MQAFYSVTMFLGRGIISVLVVFKIFVCYVGLLLVQKNVVFHYQSNSELEYAYNVYAFTHFYPLMKKHNFHLFLDICRLHLKYQDMALLGRHNENSLIWVLYIYNILSHK